MVRVCIIGAGPSGLSMIYQILKLREESPECQIDFVCYEKQKEMGGLWNYDWRTGTDEFGESQHASMYRHLWSNAPKEGALEYPDYTFVQHFGKNLPSYLPRAAVENYMKGRFNKLGISEMIQYKMTVRSVTYSSDSKLFRLSVHDVTNEQLIPEEKFDFVVNCSGHFSVPNIPEFEGLSTFPGRVLHSHDFRSAAEFKGQRVVVVGGSYSADDICMQLHKFGAESVICSYRSRAPGFKWPPGIEERPLLTRVQADTLTFCDGSTAQASAIILCTGYKHHYPYLACDLRLRSDNELYPDNLYKGIVYTLGGDGRMLYMGSQNQFYTFTMFDVQAKWIAKYIVAQLCLPAHSLVRADIDAWRLRQSQLQGWRSMLDFQSDYVIDLAKEAGYHGNLDVREQIAKWLQDKERDICTYREQCYTSNHTQVTSVPPKESWLRAKDDAMATVVMWGEAL